MRSLKPYITLLYTLIASFIIGSVVTYRVVGEHSIKLDRLEKDVMNRELIQFQLNVINEKLDKNSAKSDVFYKALLKHIQDTKN